MTTTTQLNRLQNHIRKNGPIEWSAARLVMWAGRPDRRDARFDNSTLMSLIAAGHLAQIDQENGDSLIGLN